MRLHYKTYISNEKILGKFYVDNEWRIQLFFKTYTVLPPHKLESFGYFENNLIYGIFIKPKK